MSGEGQLARSRETIRFWRWFPGVEHPQVVQLTDVQAYVRGVPSGSYAVKYASRILAPGDYIILRNRRHCAISEAEFNQQYQIADHGKESTDEAT